MPSPTDTPTPPPAGIAPLLTIPEAAVVTSLSVKALTRRIQRGTLPSEMHQGRRLVRAGELERLNLIGAGNTRAEGGGHDIGHELVRWEERFIDEMAAHRATAVAAAERERKLAAEVLALTAKLKELDGAIGQAGAFGVRRLRRKAREVLHDD